VNLARNNPPPNFIAENSSLLFVVQSNQLIEHVSSRLVGLGIFTAQKIPIYLIIGVFFIFLIFVPTLAGSKFG